MPYLNIKTNQTVKQSVISEVSSFMAKLLNKPETAMMVAIDDGVNMMHAGQSLATAFVQLKSIGLTTEQCKEIAPQMNTFFSSVLDVPEDRIYIDMQAIDKRMFASRGTTFA